MTVGNFVPEILSQKLQKNLDKTGVMMQVVNRNYEGEIKQKGSSVDIVKPGSISVRKYAGTVITDKPSSTQQNFPVDQADYFSFEVSKIEEAQSQSNLIEIYSQRAKVAIELNRDSYLQALVADAAAANTISTSIITKNNIYDKFSNAYSLLGASNALNDGKRPWIIVDYALRKLLVNCPEFTQANQLGADTLRKGAVGEIAGFEVLTSTNFAAVGGTYSIMFGTNEAITYASQVVDMERNKKDFKTTVQGLYVYGAKVVEPAALGKLVVTLS
jgi:hypothetical protein